MSEHRNITALVWREKYLDEILSELDSVRYLNGCELRRCSYFGCGRILSGIESLAGNKCTEHMNTKRIDAMDVITT